MAKHSGIITMQRMARAVALTQDLATDPLDVAVPIIDWSEAPLATEDDTHHLAVTSTLIEYRDPLAILLMLEHEREWFYSANVDDTSNPIE